MIKTRSKIILTIILAVVLYLPIGMLLTLLFLASPTPTAIIVILVWFYLIFNYLRKKNITLKNKVMLLDYSLVAIFYLGVYFSFSKIYKIDSSIINIINVIMGILPFIGLIVSVVLIDKTTPKRWLKILGNFILIFAAFSSVYAAATWTPCCFYI